MRALIWVVVVLGALYSGYWFVGAKAARGAVETQIAAMQGAGLIAETAGVSLRGFPSRFDLTLDAPRFGDPQSGIVWQAPFAQVFSLSYKPWHLIAALPEEQSLTLPGGEVLTLRAARVQASLVMRPGPSLPLDRMNLAIDAPDLSGTGGALAAAENLRFATRSEAMEPDAHEVALLLTGVRPDPALMAVLAPAGLPAVIDRLALAGVAGFDGPIRPAAPEDMPRLTRLTLEGTEIRWGDLRASAAGTLQPDATGLAEGVLTLEVTGWQALPGALQAAGLIQPEALFVVTAMLSGLAQQDGSPDVLTLPVTFGNGTAMLASWPIGPAPRLRP